MVDAQKHILVVEDEKPLAHALSTKLEHEGFHVSVAFDGNEAKAAIAERSFDAIVMDIVMPTMDGFEFLEHMKEHGQKAPTIVLSNLSQESDHQRAIDLGANEYLVKSNTPLVDIVAHVKKLTT